MNGINVELIIILLIWVNIFIQIKLIKKNIVCARLLNILSNLDTNIILHTVVRMSEILTRDNPIPQVLRKEFEIEKCGVIELISKDEIYKDAQTHFTEEISQSYRVIQKDNVSKATKILEKLARRIHRIEKLKEEKKK